MFSCDCFVLRAVCSVRYTDDKSTSPAYGNIMLFMIGMYLNGSVRPSILQPRLDKASQISIQPSSCFKVGLVYWVYCSNLVHSLALLCNGGIPLQTLNGSFDCVRRVKVSSLIGFRFLWYIQLLST